jgi:aspartokinase
MKKVQDGAVIIALNRLRRRVGSRARRQRSVFKRAPELTVRSNLVELMTYASSERMFARRKTLLERHGGRANVFLTVTQGIRETTIVAGRELREPIQAIFKGERLIDKIDGLSSVTVLLPSGTAAVPGVYHYILKTLAWEGVNIVEVVSTLNELTIVLSDRDIDRAFSLIKRLF